MLRNSYYNDVQDDILEMLKEEYQNEEELKDYIYQDGSEYFVEFDDNFKNRILEAAEDDDSITGNASGSYFYNLYEAKECFSENDGNEILRDAINEGLIEKEQVADYFLNDDYESLDVVCRFYVCSQAVDDAVNEFEQYLNENKEELLREIYLNNGGEEEC